MLDQITITGQLKALSPLHVGTGETEALRNLREKESLPGALQKTNDEDRLQSQVALVVRDANCFPCLPATSLKGCLLSACRQAEMEDDLLKELFGEISDDRREMGRMGKLRFRLARIIETSIPKGLPLPYYQRHHASYILTQVAIDRDKGTAEDKKLFNREMVPEGTRYNLRLDFAGTQAEFEAKVLPVLNLWTRPGGISLGKGQGLGLGCLQLRQEGLTARRAFFDPACFIKREEDLPVRLAAEEAATRVFTYSLKLSCEGPYLVNDPYQAGMPGDPNDPTMKGLLNKHGGASLPPSSLLGVLRARMAWEQALLAENKGKSADQIDNRHRKPEWKTPEELTITERLFGVTGWRKLVRVEAIENNKPGKPVRVSRVALDRVSCGPLDGALLCILACADVEYLVALSLEARRFKTKEVDLVFGAAGSEEERAFKAVIRGLCQNDEVLMLGHGTNQGFGWFRVQEVQV